MGGRFTDMRSLLMTMLVAAVARCDSVTVFPGAGYANSDYGWVSALRDVPGRELCVAHSTGCEHLRSLLEDEPNRCAAGAVFVADSHQTPLQLANNSMRALFVAGTMDGVARFSHFAVARHRAQSKDLSNGAHQHFAAIVGASHHSFASGTPSALAAELDLSPTLSQSEVHDTLSTIVNEFVHGAGAQLEVAEKRAGKLAAPIVAALKLEGSAALGKDICNSDFPTNPTCNYPKYPDFSLPFGPAPAPSPLPSTDCVCGSQWVTDVASPLIAGTLDGDRGTNFQVKSADAFHDVSDEHPFHLPHIWNTCQPGASCVLNVTTLTMPVLKAGSLFPNASSAPLSAFEMKAKLKSRETLLKAAGVAASSAVDKNMTICRDINERAVTWALTNADPDVRKAFEAHGEPLVMVDDQAAPIGITGPTWIKKELVYKRVQSEKGNGSHIEVQSWQFVVADLPVKSKYLPTGMHYCKLLSPARAMEWIYTDGLRAHRAIAGR